jgi:hypothetical protein
MPILEAQTSAPLITFSSDIRPTRAQAMDLADHLLLDVVNILITHHPGFNYLKDSDELAHKSYRPPPSKYKTQEYVLQTTTIEEGSTEGNIEVAQNIYVDQLKFGMNDLNNQAIPCLLMHVSRVRMSNFQHSVFPYPVPAFTTRSLFSSTASMA